jgi:hypothetical protein
MKGGDSAWQWMMKTVGDGNTQFKDALMSNNPSNNIVPISGGKRRHKKKQGGSFAQAIVPLSLVALNQMAKTKRHGHRKGISRSRRLRHLRRTYRR